MDLRPLFDGIFGKQRTVLYKRPNFERRNLDDMLKELAKIPLLQWDRYVFSREPLDGRISASQRQVYMQKAWDCGVEWADKSWQLICRKTCKCIGNGSRVCFYAGEYRQSFICRV